jgi:hypothetical protein
MGDFENDSRLGLPPMWQSEGVRVQKVNTLEGEEVMIPDKYHDCGHRLRISDKRKRCSSDPRPNHLTAEDRERLLKKGMEIIEGGSK